jgi:uncharacterized protein YndB with AHSA1/START domain
MPNIRHLVRIKSSPAKIFDAVTTARGFSVWWTRDVTGKPGQPKVLVLKFGPDYHKEVELIATEDGKSASWKCLVGDKEWVGTDIVFNLRASGDETRLFFEHNACSAYTDLFSQCSYDWTLFLRSLKSFCETGTGKPFPDYE